MPETIKPEQPTPKCILEKFLDLKKEVSLEF